VTAQDGDAHPLRHVVLDGHEVVVNLHHVGIQPVLGEASLDQMWRGEVVSK
jgi:hypothetical protein